MCFSAKAGGDQIALASHVKGLSQKDVLSGQPNTASATVLVKGTSSTSPPASENLDLLKRDDGVSRLVVSLDSGKPNTILPELDRWATLIRQLGS